MHIHDLTNKVVLREVRSLLDRETGKFACDPLSNN